MASISAADHSSKADNNMADPRFQLHPDTQRLCTEAIEHATRGEGRGRAFARMAEFVDRFNARVVGSQSLSSAMEWTAEELQSVDGLSVTLEDFQMPAWSRGHEEAFVVSPVTRRLNVLGLGFSAATPADGLEAECIVVRNWDQLDEAAAGGRLLGKIVVFNQPWSGYDDTRHYRNSGPARAAALGASAALVRSVAPFSINTPHAGVALFDPSVGAVPAACLAPEDADLLDRLQSRGQAAVRLRLTLRSETVDSCRTQNMVADLPGSDPDLSHQLVVLCAHLDSWDVGQGAMDDAGGAFVAWEAVRTLAGIGHRPRRTVRLLLFSGEELGIWGGRRYFAEHRDELASRVSYMLESDFGTFHPLGVTCSGSDRTRDAMRLAMGPLIGSAEVFESVDGPDIVQWAEVGVPVGNLVTRRQGQPEDFYFYFHHTAGDTVSVQDSAEMDRCVAVMATVAIALGNASDLLPR